MEYDETEYAREVASACGAELQEVPTAQEFVSYLPGLIYHMDEPVAGRAPFPVDCNPPRRTGVKVLLGGQGSIRVLQQVVPLQWSPT